MPQPIQNCLVVCAFGALLSSSRATTDADEACDAAVWDVYQGAFNGSSCSASGGACPSDCTDLFGKVLEMCAGKKHTDLASGNAVLFQAGHDFAYASLLLDVACREPVMDLVFSSGSYVPTCDDAVSVFAVMSYPQCSDNSMPCPRLCQSAMAATFSTCDAEHTFVPAELGEPTPVVEVTSWARRFYSPQCAADVATCDWGSGCNFSAARVDPAVDNTCEIAHGKLLWGGVSECNPYGSECPSSCTDQIQDVIDSCADEYHNDPATGNAVKFTPGVGLDQYIAMAGEVCQQPLVALILDSSAYSPTCMDAASLLLTGSSRWCTDQSAGCSALCRQIMQATYELCSAADKIDLHSHKPNASEVVHYLEGTVLSAECAADMRTCHWTSGCSFDGDDDGDDDDDSDAEIAAADQPRRLRGNN